MGAGYVNELLARLFDRAPTDSTTTNHTLNDNAETFPRGGQRLFVVSLLRISGCDTQDFSHDNEMVEILTAMGILTMDQKLPTTHIPKHRQFVLSKLVPFGARWAFERVRCGRSRHDAETDDEWKSRNMFVRVLVK